jgi:predicted dehydrogenase
LSRIRAALVGCGAHARMCILPAIRSAPVDLVAVCDSDRSRAETTARDFGATAALTEFDQLLGREDLEAVFITTPASTHAGLAVAALRAGYHVFVEKPLALNPAEARQVVEAARASGKTLLVGHNKRFAPAYLAARSCQVDPNFGRTLGVAVRYAAGNTYPDERSAAYDYAVHALDLLDFLGGPLRSPSIERVSGAERRWLWSIVGRGDKEALLTAVISTAEAWGDPGEELDIFGEGRRVHCENLTRVTYYRGAQPCWQRPVGFDPQSDALVWEPNFLVPNTMNEAIHLQGYLREVRHFAQSVLLGLQPSPGPAEGLRAIELAEAMLSLEG